VASTFTDLINHPQLLKVMAEKGYEQPTAVQVEAIPSVLEGHNLLASAKTGSGKTAAFLLPALQLLLERAPLNQTTTRLLILAPTRELARQILKTAQNFTRATPFKVVMIAGGEELKYQKALLRRNPEIVIATPGRLAEHVSHKSVDFSGLEILILDEADRMLEMGLNEDVLKIAETCPAERQTLLFSATLEQRGLRHLIKQVLQEQPAVEITVEEAANRIQQQIILVDDIKHKEKVLVALLAKSAFTKAVIFVNTKIKAAQLDGFLRYHQYAVSALHGDMTQDQRRRSLDIFRHNRTRLLIATDVAARGLDIDGIDLVINFDMARNGDDYIHRIGRTGRADQEGRAVSFIAAPDWNLMSGIERYLKVTFEKIVMPGLTAEYQGPKKIKASGKAAGIKKRKPEAGKDKTKTAASKVKVRERDKKNIGKRRAPNAKLEADAPAETPVIDGFAPLRKKPRQPIVDEE
jgi:ATP-dependent RNA helicase SrmB